MAFANSIITKILDLQSLNQELSNAILVLKSNGIHSINILFGFAWGNEYHNWTPFRVDVDNIKLEMQKAEQLKAGKFGNDDFYIIIDRMETEILFCHEHDIHLSFNTHNSVVNDLLKIWGNNMLLRKK